jgi:putative hemolysin
MIDFFIILSCLILNAFFSAYEMAFVTVSREEIDQLEGLEKTHKKLLLFKKAPERTLSVIQIGITLVGAIAAAVGGTGAVESLEPWMVEKYAISHSMAEAISVTVVIVPLTYFSVVFGELVPKSIALKHPIKVIEFGTTILGLIDRFLSPIVSFLETSTNYLLTLLGLNTGPVEDESMGEIVEIGNLPEYHQKFVQNLVALKGRKVSKAMIPWDKVIHLHFSDSEEEVRSKIYQTPHSRFPVIDGETMVGILLKKEIPDSYCQLQTPWQGLLHAAIKVSDSDKVLEAFLKMQEKKTPLSVVENAKGDYVGIITIEDIIEEVVGDIEEEHDYSKTSKLLSNRPRINLKG